MSIPFLSTQTCPSYFRQSPCLAGFLELSSPDLHRFALLSYPRLHAMPPSYTLATRVRAIGPSWFVFASGRSQFLLTCSSSCCSFLHSTDPQFKTIIFPRVCICTLMYPSSDGLRISTTIFPQRRLAGCVLCTLHNPSLNVLLLRLNLCVNLLCACCVPFRCRFPRRADQRPAWW